MKLDHQCVLVTGAAGFIGAFLCEALLNNYEGIRVVGIDSMNDYYEVSLKEYRLERLRALAQERACAGCGFVFVRGNMADKDTLDGIFETYAPDIVVNLAAQAGVRYSIDHPDVYIESNLIGFYNLLEACRHSYDGGKKGVAHLVYASSSSVYGNNKKVPYSTDDKVDNPISLYAATKKSDELLAHAYAKLYDIPSAGETIEIFNYGNCKRDFTYIDDIVEGIQRVMVDPPERKTGEDGLPVPPYKLYNIGNSHPENLLDFVRILSEELLRAGVLPPDYDFEAHKKLVPMQPGDVEITYADTEPLERDYGFRPSTPLREGLRRFAEWYREYYKIGGTQE